MSIIYMYHAFTCGGDCVTAILSSDAHTVLVLGPEDGHSQLTGVARSLCQLVQQHHMTARDIDTTLIDNKLLGSSDTLKTNLRLKNMGFCSCWVFI